MRKIAAIIIGILLVGCKLPAPGIPEHLRGEYVINYTSTSEGGIPRPFEQVEKITIITVTRDELLIRTAKGMLLHTFAHATAFKPAAEGTHFHCQLAGGHRGILIIEALSNSRYLISLHVYTSSDLATLVRSYEYLAQKL